MKKYIPKKSTNPKRQRCKKCNVLLSGIWWIQIGYHVWCERHYKLGSKK